MACHNSNKPFEWTYHHQLSASPPQTPCLPLKASVGLTSEVLKAAKIKSFHPLLNMSYQVYKTNSAEWYLITIDQTGLEAARNDVGKHYGPFCLWKTIDSLGVIGMDEETIVSSNLEAYGYHMQNSMIEFTEQPG